MTPPSPSNGRSRGGGTDQTPPSQSQPGSPLHSRSRSISSGPRLSSEREGGSRYRVEREGTGRCPPPPKVRCFPPGSTRVPAFPRPRVLPAFPGVSQAGFLGEVGSPRGSSEGLGAPGSQAGIPVGLPERLCSSVKSMAGREGRDWGKLEPSQGSHTPPHPSQFPRENVSGGSLHAGFPWNNTFPGHSMSNPSIPPPSFLSSLKLFS